MLVLNGDYLFPDILNAWSNGQNQPTLCLSVLRHAISSPTMQTKEDNPASNDFSHCESCGHYRR